MTFSAKKFIEDRLVVIEDEIKQVLAQRDAAAAGFDARLKELLLEREEWGALVGEEPAPASARKTAAKKTTTK